MLAERKSRQKWSQDPRNTFWANDTSKYGQRMLEKMGWSEGKGLGANEDGEKEHIKIRKRENKLGIGAKRGRDEDWIDQQETFDSILAELNAEQTRGGVAAEGGEDVGEDGCGKKACPLVNKAVDSNRAMYKKFLRSKDLSVVSSHDMDCVFGRKRPKHSKDKSKRGSSPAAEEGNLATTVGITTVTRRQSYQEYFSSKMKSSLKAHLQLTTCEEEEASSGSETEGQKRSKQGRDRDLDRTDVVEEEQLRGKKKRRRARNPS